MILRGGTSKGAYFLAEDLPRDPAQRDRLYAQSPYNVVRIDLSRDTDPYQSAAATLAAWRDEGAVAADETPSLYLYAQKFPLPDGSLRDVADGPAGDDASLRPNQLLAASLPDGPLDHTGIAVVLDSLTCKMCVASSGRPERLQYALSLVGLYDRFHPHVFSAVEVTRGKPAPDLFLHAAARMDALPARCVVVEDSVPGVIGAVAAGMTVIGFVGASHCRPEDAARLAAHGAATVVDDMTKLLRALA